MDVCLLHSLERPHDRKCHTYAGLHKRVVKIILATDMGELLPFDLANLITEYIVWTGPTRKGMEVDLWFSQYNVLSTNITKCVVVYPAPSECTITVRNGLQITLLESNHTFFPCGWFIVDV